MATLILYTRVGCCLCAGLEERLRTVLPAAGTPAAVSEETPAAAAPTPGDPSGSLLGRIRLRCVDVDSDPALQARYGLSVPVLALAKGPDGAITPLPPVSPRLQGEPLRGWLLRHLVP